MGVVDPGSRAHACQARRIPVTSTNVAALPTIADVIRYAVKGHCVNGQPWVNVQHFKKASASSTAAAIALFEPELTKRYTALGYGGTGRGWANMAALAAGVETVTYTPLYGSLASIVHPLVIAGGTGGDALPSDTAWVVSYQSSQRGARNRGRLYFAAPVEDACDSTGHIIAAKQAFQLSNEGAFIAATTAAGVIPQIASYKFSTSVDIISASMDNVFDRQRRRAR